MVMEQRISKEEVEHVARLARLHLTTEEIEKYTEQLGEVLNYVDRLPEVPVTNNKSPVTARSELREDRVVSSEASTQELLANTPQKEGTSIKVPAVFGGEK